MLWSSRNFKTMPHGSLSRCLASIVWCGWCSVNGAACGVRGARWAESRPVPANASTWSIGFVNFLVFASRLGRWLCQTFLNMSGRNLSIQPGVELLALAWLDGTFDPVAGCAGCTASEYVPL